MQKVGGGGCDKAFTADGYDASGGNGNDTFACFFQYEFMTGGKLPGKVWFVYRVKRKGLDLSSNLIDGGIVYGA